MIMYGVWRFIIEFFRADDRGSTIVSFLSPSQLIAVLMIAGSFGVFYLEKWFRDNHKIEVKADVNKDIASDEITEEKVDADEKPN